MEEQKLTYYLEGYAAGTLTVEEQEELRLMLQDPANEEALNRLLDADWPRWEQSDLQFPEGFERVQLAVRERVEAERIVTGAGVERDGELPVVGRRYSLGRVWAAAAAVIVLLTTGLLWWRGHADRTRPVVSDVPVATDIQPGKQGAILTLADGSQVSLDSMQNGAIALQQGNGATAQLKNGVLEYGDNRHATGYNTISTPKGRIFALALPDGTRVWLNSASTVRYPVSFAGDVREVQLTGEAYFEVASDKLRPFKLAVEHKAAVEVLGTRFNVNAYDNEHTIVATLLDGAVKVLGPVAGTGSGPASVILKPGQQAQLPMANDGRIKVINNADIDRVMAWKNGLFDFEGLRLEDVMRQCERWYDVDVVYEKGIPEMELSGKMTKDVTLSQLLEGLKMFNVHYRLEGRRLIILP